MRNFYIAIVLFFSLSAFSQTITFANPQLLARLNQCNTSNGYAKDINGNPIEIDTNNNNTIEVDEALPVYELNLGGVTPYINSLIGMEHFVNIRWLSLYQARPSNTDLAALFPNLKVLGINSMGGLVTNINISGLDLEELICDDNAAMLPYLTGSESMAQFPNLKVLSCLFNGLSSLDVSMLPSLEQLYCFGNELETLNVTGLANLEYISAGGNDLMGVDISTCTALTALILSENPIANLTISGSSTLESVIVNNCPTLVSVTLDNLPALTTFQGAYGSMSSLNLNELPSLGGIDVNGSSLTLLDASGLPSLTNLLCESNELTSLNLDGCALLTSLNCSANQLTTLDISSCVQLSNVNCVFNNLQTLFIKNASYNGFNLNMAENPELQYICADEYEVVAIQAMAEQNGYTNCTVNSYCSFLPGGDLFAIHGAHRFDADGNGCSTADLSLPMMKYKIISANYSGTAISGSSGNYNIPLPAGTHTIEPRFESFMFGSIPVNRTVAFPGAATDITQDFCITTFGDFPDIEVILLPLDVARPGFDTKYRLIYRNKGNRVHNGVVTLNFDNNTTDLMVSSPTPNNQSGNVLSWDYTSLLPFQTREINLTLNLNSPTETPALNAGSMLAFQATITSQLSDINPSDNTLAHNQSVFNSYDPNDKTCVQGATIPLNMVGNYVTYVIRFENTGTFAAQNIVVADIINTAKYDIDSFIPLTGSHPFVSRMVAPNRLEFIFEDINLPFDDSNNDGFVAFKIKTKSTLAVGNTFENSASIYFDYNFPIVTDPAVTTVTPFLGNDAFDFGSKFTLHPNPSKSTVFITANDGTQINSVSIYNLIGQLLITQTGVQNHGGIDITAFASGQYILQVRTDKGMSSGKFIKQ